MVKKIVACVALLACFSFLRADYAKLSSFKEIASELKNSDQTTLIVLDIDEVLITTEDHFIHPYADGIFMLLVREAMADAKTSKEKMDVEEKLSLSMLKPKRALVEEEMPELIKELKEKGVKLIALTSCPTGKFGVIPNVERWRIDHLSSLGISFSSSFPGIGRQFLTEIATQGKTAPLYEEGILFSKGYKKGEVLKAFLKQSNFRPSKVIFVDDLRENLDSVKGSLKAMNIEFKGYQYVGASRFFKKKPDAAVLNYQFGHLIKNGEWLSDAEVEKRLRGKR